MAVFRSIGRGIRSFVRQITHVPKTVNGKPFVSNVVPLARGASIVGKAGSVAKSFYEGIKTFTTKKTINPAAGVSGAKNILSKLGKAAGVGATVGAIFQGGREIAKAGVSGDVPSVSDVSKSLTKGVVTGAGLGLSPLGGAIGALEGGGKKISTVAQQFWDAMRGKGKSVMPDGFTNPFKDPSDVIKNIRLPDQNFNFTVPEGFTTQGMMPQTPQNIFIETPQTPQASFSPNLSFGGMGGGLAENLPLLLLLGGGLAGFAVGRKTRKKKRKKKKYKKRRSY